MNEDKMYHIGLSKSDIKGAKFAILPGDPGRVEKIAAALDEAEMITSKREYTSYLGKIKMSRNDHECVKTVIVAPVIGISIKQNLFSQSSAQQL